MAIIAAGAGTIAYFNDTETSKGNTFTAGELDLRIDWTEYYNGELIENRELGDLDGEPIFMLEDIKPGDNGEATISIHVSDNPALLWINLENIVENERGMNEPEMEVDDDNTGDLSEHMMFTVWIDDGGGDPGNNILDDDEIVLCEDILADIDSVGPAYIENCCVYYLAVHWSLPWDTGNVVQSDSLSADISFYAEQARHNPAMENAYVPPCPSEEPADNCAPCEIEDGVESENIEILSVEKSGSPSISAFVRVDTAAGIAGNLVENFMLCEDEFAPLDMEVSFTSESAADIVVVFDDTGSMGDEIFELQAAVGDFVNGIENAGIDARYALVSFKDATEIDQDFTDNAELFIEAVDDLTASGGGDFPEDDWDGIAVATRNKASDIGGENILPYRTGAQRVIIDITDAVAHTGDTDFTGPEIAAMLDGYTYIAISPDFGASYSNYIDKRILAENVGGIWIDIESSEDLGELIDEVGGLLSTVYTIEYTTCNSAMDGSIREILIAVEDPEAGTIYKTTSYKAP